MKMRILAAFLAVLLLTFALSSCEIPQFISELFTQETTAETTVKQEIELPPIIDGSFFEAHFIDVGQGDSVLVQTSEANIRAARGALDV